MPKNNLYLIPEKIEKQKLAEEVRELTETPWWQEYQSQVNNSPLSPAARNKVISKSGSDYLSERGKEGYGPMPVDSQALMIAGSQSIMSKIERDFPNVARLLRWNQKATLGFLKEKNAFSAYRGQNAFRIPCSKTDDYSKTGPAAWSEYLTRIRQYVSEICQRTPAIETHFEKLRPAREVLANYIWDEYYKILPYWPSVGGTNSRSFEADKADSYEHSGNHIVWNCLGWIYVKDERTAYEILKLRLVVVQR
ncbi:MAG: hypothetical protein MRERC_2c094 [Mycoplasmataceae bacterium RC_NB112A]|nr:MAG: hypothetical protein MRERC_2c094 [Mycoplasmataceae bacterium RC_NB112A]